MTMHNYTPVADDEDIRCIYCDARPSTLEDDPCPGPGGPGTNLRAGCDACHRGTIVGIIDSRIGDETLPGWFPVERCDNCGIWTDDKQAAWALSNVDVIEADYNVPDSTDPDGYVYITQMWVRPLDPHDGRFFSEGGDTDPLTI